MAHVQINNSLYLKSPITVNMYRLSYGLRYVYATVNIHNPLTALVCFGTPPKIDSSNCTINSMWLSEQQVLQMSNFGRKHQRYLPAMQYKPREDYLG